MTTKDENLHKTVFTRALILQFASNTAAHPQCTG